MGSVWLAHDQSLDAPCAIKLVNDDLVGSEEVRVRFAREAKVAAQLRNPHVVSVFDYGPWDGTLYLAMEFLEGEDLGARLDRVGTLDAASTYRLVAHVARALMAAHAMGIVHRDLKPENVFLVRGYDEEIAKVLDFGIARHDACSLDGMATRTGSFLGSPLFVSPEQARGKLIDHRADLWSLGVITFMCLTGRPPFEADALGELMGLILYEPLPKPTAYNPALPPAVDVWWLRAAARERAQRFQTAKELVDALAIALGLDPSVNVPSFSASRNSEPPGITTGSGVFTPFPRRPSSDGRASFDGRESSGYGSPNLGPGRISRPSDMSALRGTDASAVRVRPSRVHPPAEGAFASRRGGTRVSPWMAAALALILGALVAALVILGSRRPAPLPALPKVTPVAVRVHRVEPSTPSTAAPTPATSLLGSEAPTTSLSTEPSVSAAETKPPAAPGGKPATSRTFRSRTTAPVRPSAPESEAPIEPSLPDYGI